MIDPGDAIYGFKYQEEAETTLIELKKEFKQRADPKMGYGGFDFYIYNKVVVTAGDKYVDNNNKLERSESGLSLIHKQ